MPELKNIETSALIEMLVQRTEEYTKLLKQGTTGPEIHQAEYNVALIQSEINSRKDTGIHMPLSRNNNSVEFSRAYKATG